MNVGLYDCYEFQNDCNLYLCDSIAVLQVELRKVRSEINTVVLLKVVDYKFNYGMSMSIIVHSRKCKCFVSSAKCGHWNSFMSECPLGNSGFYVR